MSKKLCPGCGKRTWEPSDFQCSSCGRQVQPVTHCFHCGDDGTHVEDSDHCTMHENRGFVNCRYCRKGWLNSNRRIAWKDWLLKDSIEEVKKCDSCQEEFPRTQTVSWDDGHARYTRECIPCYRKNIRRKYHPKHLKEGCPKCGLDNFRLMKTDRIECRECKWKSPKMEIKRKYGSTNR